MKHRETQSFASRVSLKTVLQTSILFLTAVLLIMLQGGFLMYKRAIKYSSQSLNTSILDVEQNISRIENTASSIAAAFEELYNSKFIIDTARCYSLLSRTLKENEGIIGCGFYFEPYCYNPKNVHAGIYANSGGEQGEIGYEWDDDRSFMEDGWSYFVCEWYTKVKEIQQPVWMSPFLESVLSTDDKQLMTTYSYPLKDSSGRFFGVFAIDMSLDWLYDKLLDIRPYSHSNVILADEELNFICNPLSEAPYEGSLYDTPFIPGFSYTVDESVRESAVTDLVSNSDILTVYEKGKASFLVFGSLNNGWILCVSSLFKDVFRDITQLVTVLLILTLIFLPVLYALNRRQIHKLARPIKDFANAASKITDGRFDVPIPEVKTKDELMELGNALTYMQNSVTDYIGRLQSTTAEKERLKSELNVAKTIQTQMLSHNFPKMANGGIYASSSPAREVGGDLYDFFLSGDNLYFILGDVSGKGVPAALLMAITIAAFRAAGKNNHTVDEVVSLINNTFCRSNEDMMFVTLVVGKIDLNSGEVSVCNAGHNPMVYVSKEGKAEFMKVDTNVACGIMPDFKYTDNKFILEKGCRLIVYSDGITEAETVDKDQYGEQRLLEWASANGSGVQTEEQVVDKLLLSVHNFTHGAEQNDDMTILSVSI